MFYKLIENKFRNAKMDAHNFYIYGKFIFFNMISATWATSGPRGFSKVEFLLNMYTYFAISDLNKIELYRFQAQKNVTSVLVFYCRVL